VAAMMEQGSGDVSARRRALVGAVALTGAFLLALSVEQPTEAAFPGKPGKIAFKRTGPCCDIWAVDLKGNETQLTDNAYSQGDPSYSADGKLITFRGRPPGGIGDADIFVMNADGSNERQLTTDDAYEDNEPNFLPDGRTIIFESDRDGDSDIYRLNVSNGGGIEPIVDTDGGVDENSPAVSPNGKVIAFNRFDSGDTGIHAFSIDGTKPRKIVDTDEQSEFEPNWSPDGRSIAYVVSSNVVMEDSEIWVAKATGKNPHPVTENDDEDDTPAFSPDGTRLTFDSTFFAPDPMNEVDEIVTLNLKTGTMRRLIDQTSEDDTTPDWAPIPVRCGGKRSTLVGTPGKDKLFGTPGADVIAGLGGGDLIKGKGGKDRLCGGKGRDRLNGGAKRDRCVGGKGLDRAKGCERSRSL
jgi:Tol biopolymer transport system component